MQPQSKPSNYGELVRRSTPARPAARKTDAGLEGLLTQYEQQRNAPRLGAEEKPDALAALRFLMTEQLIPAFDDLARKYEGQGIEMRMDTENLLNGGNEFTIEFHLGECRAKLSAVVTTTTIAFHETRSAKHIAGELASGPSLPLRNLNAEVFHRFLCERLKVLVRTAMRYQ